MNLLLFTDHETHSSSNSFYLVANSLLKHKAVDRVFIASRSVEENKAFFEGKRMRLHLREQLEQVEFETFPRWISEENEIVESLSLYDYILLRLPRPIAPNFFDFLGCQINEHKIINRPSGIKITGSKKFLLELQQYTAPIQLLNNVKDIKSFKNLFPVVLKPLEDYGGRGIIKIDDQEVFFGNEGQMSFEDFEKWYLQNPSTYLGMKFLKNVKNGDKRIVVANGVVLASSLRFPAEESWLCNVAQGGSARLSEITLEEEEIIASINSMMKSHGIFMYGLDTLEDDNGKRVISELNTLSVGGLAPSAEYTGKNLGGMFADLFVEFVKDIA